MQSIIAEGEFFYVKDIKNTILLTDNHVTT